jgi:1,5-anhydro-D-fructose reductase (1,5-anhydro-D-mannitol-forming)
VRLVPTPLRIAILGLWHVHAIDYAEDAGAHPDTEILAVWDDDDRRGRAGAGSIGVPFEPDLGALLARSDLDAVVVTTGTSRHHEVMVRAAAARKHIFTEKVLAPTVDEAEAIIGAADAAGVRLFVSLPRLYAGYTAAIADIVDQGSLGRLVYARVRLSHDGAVPTSDRPGWLPERFFDPGTAIGGALTDLGCHPVYLVQRFLGTHPETVAATYGSVTGRAVEDQAVVTLGYAGGELGVIEAGFVNEAPFTIELGGTHGSVRYTEDHPALVAVGAAFGGEGAHELPVPDDGPGPFARWVEHIRTGTRADDNLARAVELTRLVVAANRAAAEGRTIAYPA